MSGAAKPQMASRRARLSYLGVGALLAAILLLTWGLGGFQTRTRPLETVAPGATITTGPYELVFTRATAQHQPKTSYAPATWKVVMQGSGRTTGDETISPTVFDDGMFLARDPRSSEVQPAQGQRFGAGEGSGNGFTPGLPPIPYRVEFVFGDAYRPGPTVRFGIIAQRYGNNDLIQTADAESGWRNDDHGFQLDLPVTVLPEETS